MMKKVLATLLCMAVLGFTSVQAQTLNWANNTQSTTGNAYGRSIAVDASDNSYIVGNYHSTVDFDPGSGVNNFSSAGSFDIFVQKLDAAGNFVWAKSFGGADADIAYDVAVTTDGFVYVTGTFRQKVKFTPNDSCTAVGGTDIFVLKLNTNGDFQMVKSLGSGGDDQGVAIEANPNFYVLGCQVGSTINFATGSSPAVTAGGGVVAKYQASNDSVIFATGAVDYMYNVKIDKNHNIYTTGISLSRAFVSKYDALGDTLVWTWACTGPVGSAGNSLAVDDSGYVYNGGYFNGTVDFDNTSGVSNINSIGTNDIYVVKINSSGNFVWVNSMFGEDKRCLDIQLSNTGYIFTTGYFKFNPLSINTAGNDTTILDFGDFTGFVVVFKPNGHLHIARSLGSANQTVIYAAAFNSQEDYIFTGYHDYSFDADPSANAYTLTATTPTIQSFAVSWKYSSLTNKDYENPSSIVNLYPNPTNSQLNMIVKEATTIQILNSLGTVIHSQNLGIGNNTLDVQHVSAGIYFIRSENGKALTFIKE